MIKKTIKYKNFLDEDEEQVAYFHLSKLEIMEFSIAAGDLLASMNVLSNSKNQLEIYRVLKDTVGMAYGERSQDGRRFHKTKEMREGFMSSPALEALIFELMEDSSKAAEFFTGILPAEIDEETRRKVSKEFGQNIAAAPTAPQG